MQRARQLAKQFQGLVRGRSANQVVSDPEHPRWLGCLLAFAYPDRIAQQRRAGGADYRLANGRAAQFGETDALMKHEWLVVADLGSHQGQREERIYLVADLDPALFDQAGLTYPDASWTLEDVAHAARTLTQYDSSGAVSIPGMGRLQ